MAGEAGQLHDSRALRALEREQLAAGHERQQRRRQRAGEQQRAERPHGLLLVGVDRPQDEQVEPGEDDREREREGRVRRHGLPARADDQLAGVHDPGRVQLALTARSSATPSVADLGRQLGRVVAADRVVVGDRAAGGDDRLAGRAPWRAPLLDRLVALLRARGR